MDRLRDMGFSETEISFALEAVGGNAEAAVELLLETSPRLVSSDATSIVLDISQYLFSQVDTSACTTIACSALPQLLESLDENQLLNKEKLSAMLIEGIEHHRHVTSVLGLEHVSVEEVVELLPSLTSSLSSINITSQRSLTSPDCFEKLVQEAIDSCPDINRHIGVIVTKPPETVALIINPAPTGRQLLFDSHSRPQLGLEGAYLLSSDLMGIVSHLKQLFPAPSGQNIQSMSLMEEMYYSFEANAYQRKN